MIHRSSVPGAVAAALRFEPETLLVAPADTVTWRNAVLVPHTVSAEELGWDSRLLAGGREYTRIVDAKTADRYRCRYHLGKDDPVTDTVAAWRDYLPRYLLLPHPSLPNTHWVRLHPWFERKLIPALRRGVAALIRWEQDARPAAERLPNDGRLVGTTEERTTHVDARVNASSATGLSHGQRASTAPSSRGPIRTTCEQSFTPCAS